MDVNRSRLLEALNICTRTKIDRIDGLGDKMRRGRSHLQTYTGQCNGPGDQTVWSALSWLGGREDTALSSSILPWTWPPGDGWVWKTWVAVAGECAVVLWLEVSGGKGSPYGCSDLVTDWGCFRNGQMPAAGDSGVSTPTSWSTTSAALTALSTSRPSASRS